MGFHRFGAATEDEADFSVGFTLARPEEHLPFPRAQRMGLFFGLDPWTADTAPPLVTTTLDETNGTLSLGFPRGPLASNLGIEPILQSSLNLAFWQEGPTLSGPPSRGPPGWNGWN